MWRAEGWKLSICIFCLQDGSMFSTADKRRWKDKRGKGMGEGYEESRGLQRDVAYLG